LAETSILGIAEAEQSKRFENFAGILKLSKSRPSECGGRSSVAPLFGNWYRMALYRELAVFWDDGSKLKGGLLPGLDVAERCGHRR